MSPYHDDRLDGDDDGDDDPKPPWYPKYPATTLTQAVTDVTDRIQNAKVAGRRYVLAFSAEGAANARLVSGNAGRDDKQRWAALHDHAEARYDEFLTAIQALGDQTGYSTSLSREIEHAAGYAYRTALVVTCREIGGSE